MIETVLGPIQADALGPTSSHDHLLADSSSLRRDGARPAPPLEPVTTQALGYLRWNMLASRDNLVLGDRELAARELAAGRDVGLRAVIESTSWGLGPDLAGLPEIARRSGVAVIASYGAYIRRTLPAHVAALDEGALERDLHLAVTEHAPGVDFRAGVIGIMGTTAEFPAEERAMMRAAARVGAATGAPVSIRLDPDSRGGEEIIALCVGEGLAPGKILLTNADEYMDLDYWERLAATGAVLEMCFGTEAQHDGRVANPSDPERLAFFAEASARLPDARFTLGESVWTKAQLRSFGGYGYGYILERIVPALRAAGLADGRIAAMLVDEPRRLLDRPGR